MTLLVHQELIADTDHDSNSNESDQDNAKPE